MAHFISILNEITIAGNPLWRLLLFFILILLSLVVGKLSRIALHRAAHSPAESRTWMTVLLGALEGPAMLLAFAFGMGLATHAQVLLLPQALQAIMETAVRVLWAVGLGYTCYRATEVVDYFLGRMAAATSSRVNDMLVPLVGRTVRILILVLVVAQVFQAISDQPLTSVLAGLGVGGLAIALAGQDTIKNFFGSLVIVADKPFEIGDRIEVDGHDGSVESVGFRSTRIRTLEGAQVTVPNSEMVSKSIRNLGRRPFVRRVATISITYDTPPAKVAEALAILRELLDGHEGMRPELPPRVFFNEFANSALNLLMIYWYHPLDYWAYMAYSERLNLEILKRFNAAGISFAFPTQTVHVASMVGPTLGLPGGTEATLPGLGT